jgi:hypothetical protein
MLGNGPDDTVLKDFKELAAVHFQIEDTQPYYGIKKVAIQLPSQVKKQYPIIVH